MLLLVLHLIRAECDIANARAISEMESIGIPNGKGVLPSLPISKKEIKGESNREKISSGHNLWVIVSTLFKFCKM